MDTKIAEIADGIYRLSTYVPDVAPPALNKVGGDPLSGLAVVVAAQIGGQVREARIK